MKLKIADLPIAIVAALAIAGAEASMLDSLGSRSGQGAASTPASALSAAPLPLHQATLADPGGAGSFLSASSPGHWVKEFSPETGGERTKLFFSLNTFDFISVARFASSVPLVVMDGEAGGVVGHGAAGPAFIETAMASSRFSTDSQPNAYAMLLAGLVLIVMVARQRMGQE